MPLTKDQLDNKIFYLLAAALFAAMAYIFLITFVPIPKENIRFADTAQGFLLGTVIGSVIAYFVGGSPNAKITPAPQPLGTTTADVHATITTAEPSKEKEE